jgi:hypothetical protein
MTDRDTDKPQDAPARKETARETYTRLIAENPRFKEAPKTGQGFEIVGAKR